MKKTYTKEDVIAFIKEDRERVIKSIRHSLYGSDFSYEFEKVPINIEDAYSKFQKKRHPLHPYYIEKFLQRLLRPFHPLIALIIIALLGSAISLVLVYILYVLIF